MKPDTGHDALNEMLLEARADALTWAADQVDADRVRGFYQKLSNEDHRVAVLLERLPSTWLRAEAAKLRREKS